MTMRASDSFNTTLTWSYNDIDLPGGEFQTNLVGLRTAYSFNPRLFIQTLIQYNDRANIWSSNIRFGWLRAANTGLFVVYNDTRGLEDLRDSISDRSLLVKWSWLFDLLQ